MHKGLREPHVLLASSNPAKLIRNLAHILNAAELQKLHDDVDANVIQLFRLGEVHFAFAQTIVQAEWRQRVSRLYYAAYNVRRAVALQNNGAFSTDASDHKTVDELPAALANVSTYKTKLRDLREDRNLADYSHTAVPADLLIQPNDAQTLVTNFIVDCRTLLTANGITI